MVGKNNQANRKAKKRKLRRQRAIVESLRVGTQKVAPAQKLAGILRRLALEVLEESGENEARLNYLQDAGRRFLKGEIEAVDFHFTEEEEPRAQNFLDTLLVMRTIKKLALEKVSADGLDDEGGVTLEVSDIQDKAVRQEAAWCSHLHSRHDSCHHHSSQEQKAQLAPGL